jgi:SWI/SNF-related matrix-associated actin-dependent regulator of chromatin subfamily A-like protein 1
MQLDFVPSTGYYVLRVPRAEGEPMEIMREFGLDLSVSASSHGESVLFTKEPYAAATFGHTATPVARESLSYILEQVERSWAPTSLRHIDVPDGKELWDFQRASVDYALSREHALIGDEPGLGKTPIAISVANEMQTQRVLVVCLASIRYQWVRRIEEWRMGRRRPGDCYAIVSSKRGVDDDAAWTVVSWELVRSPGIWKALAKGRYDLLILDEAHYAKTIDVKRTRSIFGGGRDPVATPLIERAARTLALTGTPLPNRPREAYVLARHLCWESIDFLGERAFNERFNPQNKRETTSGKVWVDEAIGRMGELQNRLRCNFMVRHLKRDVMTQLKLPVYDLIRVEETTAVKAALAAESLLGIDPENLEGADAKILGQIATARRLMGEAMAPQVGDYLATLVEGGEEKLVVFAWHVSVIDMLVERLHRYGVVRIGGGDTPRSKDAKVQAFINRPSIHRSREGVSLIIGNTLSLGTGTDGLQNVATHCLIAEPDWTPGNNQQAIDRLDRGGQKGMVQADLFVAPGSISEKVLASALRKLDITHKALDRRAA